MIAAERHKRIQELIARTGLVTVQQLCDDLDVSDMTVRRDLVDLEGRGLLARVRGGAQSVEQDHGRPTPHERAFNVRLAERTEQKHKIGRAASGLVREGQSVFLDGSSTCLHLAEFLRAFERLTVLTDSLAVMGILGRTSDIELIVLGGSLQSDGNTIDGPLALENIERLAVETLFFSCSGYDVNGVYNPGLIGTNIKRALIRKAARHILLAGSEKCGVRDFYALCPLNQVHTVVSDAELSDENRQLVRECGVELVIAT